MRIKLEHSKAYRGFKRRIGQANHFLITIMVGLSEVKKGGVQKPDSMDVKWDPRDVRFSALRSMRYALNSSLAWVVDNFDAYVQVCKRNPKIIQDEDFFNEINSANRSVNEKFKSLFYKYRRDEKVEIYGALVALGIQWRNNTTHSDANNTIDKEFEDILRNKRNWYLENCCHLDTSIALIRFNRHSNPSLKEVASIIKANLCFIEAVDALLIKELNIHRYISEVFEGHFKKMDQTEQDQRVLLPTMKPKRQYSRIQNILLSNGFSVAKDDDGFVIDANFMLDYFEEYMK